MKYNHIRNATGNLTINHTTFLIDPFLAPKGMYPGFEGTFNNKVRIPLVELPSTIDELLIGVDALVVTHTHPDHWDETAAQTIPKSLPIFVQHTGDKQLIESQGFTDVRVIYESVEFNGITLTKTGGSHGTVQMYAMKPLADILQDAMGVVFQAPGEPTIYLVGDTIWTSDVEKTLQKFNPDVAIMNTGYARIIGFEDSIIMGVEDIGRMARRVPNIQMIAVHMETVNHTATNRNDVRRYCKGEELEDRVFIPEDGETIEIK